MAFQQGLSGLNTSAKGLDVVGNNIANASTVGFKVSSAHFADVYAASLNGSAASQIGIGSMLASVFQQFTQGNISTTNNPLDLAINGGGFFSVVRDGMVAYTRNGQFHNDLEGYIINDQGYRLMGYPVSDTGQIIPSTPVAIKIDAGNIAPRPTGDASGGDARMQINLDSGAAAPTNSPFNPLNPLTYTYSTAQTFYDTLGVEHNITYYFVSNPPLTPGANRPWHLYATLDGDPSTVTQMSDLVFDNNGMPVSQYSGILGATTTGITGVKILGTPDGHSYRVAYTGAPPTGYAVTDLSATPPTTLPAVAGSQPNTILVGGAVIQIAGTPVVGDEFFIIPYDVTAGSSNKGRATIEITDVNFAPTGNYTIKYNASTLEFEVTDNATGLPPVPPPPPYPYTPPATVITLPNGMEVTITDSTGLGGQVEDGDRFYVSTSEVRKPLPREWEIYTGAESPLGSNQPNFFIDFTGSTSFAGQSTVNSNYQGGFAQGMLKNISVGLDGIVLGNYSNGQGKVLAQIVLTTFPNMNGLVDAGNNLLLASAASGQPLVGVPETGARGQLRSLAVEESNVDMTNELITMITLQRNYQANAQTVKTQDQIMQTIVNLR